jgi:uncharacterized integral membrane protein
VTEQRVSRRDGIAGLSWRTIAGIALALLVVLFAALNRDETEVSFVVFSTGLRSGSGWPSQRWVVSWRGS